MGIKRASKKAIVDVESIREEYRAHSGIAERVRACLFDQLSNIIQKSGVTLGVPLESRVKSLSSIEEKIERKAVKLTSLLDLPDLVGLRVILLFQRDVDEVGRLISDNLDVVEKEDAGSKLEFTQFGYQSQHFLVRIPSTWLAVPTYSELGGITAELQVRTLAQHIWAVASHKLQYKREASVPVPLRRTISRASALLETVDLEFSRVLDERDRYVREDLSEAGSDEELNVDSVAAILEQYLPSDNKYEDEAYDELLHELTAVKILTRGDLEIFIKKYREAALNEDREMVESVLKAIEEHGDEEEARARQGVYFSHTGLARMALAALRKSKPS